MSKRAAASIRPENLPRRFLRWVARHPDIKAVYINPADLPKEYRDYLGMFSIEGCVILKSKAVPKTKFWPVPGEHGAQMWIYHRNLAHLKSLQHFLLSELEKLSDE